MSTCIICGCSDDRPCLGAAIFASIVEAAWVHRLVPEEDLLAAGSTCSWLDQGHTICSAHPAEELASYGFAVARHGNGLFEFGLGDAIGEPP